MKWKRPNCSGFSLIEIILVLIIMGIAAVIIIPYFQSGVINSVTMVNRQETIFNLNSVMANMIEDYEDNYTTNLGALSAKIGASGSQSSTYGDVGSGTMYTYQVDSKSQVDIGGGTGNGLAITIADPNDDIRLYYLFTDKGPCP